MLELKTYEGKSQEEKKNQGNQEGAGTYTHKLAPARMEWALRQVLLATVLTYVTVLEKLHHGVKQTHLSLETGKP